MYVYLHLQSAPTWFHLVWSTIPTIGLATTITIVSLVEHARFQPPEK